MYTIMQLYRRHVTLTILHIIFTGTYTNSYLASEHLCLTMYVRDWYQYLLVPITHWEMKTARRQTRIAIFQVSNNDLLLYNSY